MFLSEKETSYILLIHYQVAESKVINILIVIERGTVSRKIIQPPIYISRFLSRIRIRKFPAIFFLNRFRIRSKPGR